MNTNNIQPLEPSALRWRCEAGQFDFDTSDQLDDLNEILGQKRALDAVQFGIGIRREGYNLYVLGPPGLGKRTVVRQFVEQKAANEPTPPDWCYVNNFQQVHKPQALQLPAGRGAELRDDMKTLVEDLQTEVPAALEGEEHRTRIEDVQRAAKAKHEKAFEALAEKADTQGIRLVRTPDGFALAPIHKGEVIGPEEFEQLADEEKQRIEKIVADLQFELKEIVTQAPQWKKESRDKIKELNRQATQLAVDHLISQVKQKYADLSDVTKYLDEVQDDVIEHADQFRLDDEETPMLLGMPMRERPSFQDYQVNLLVDNGPKQDAPTPGAPVIYEEHPTYQNLLGRVEHKPHMGSLLTEFTLIKPGALHRANGGYLVIDAIRMLMQPYAWEGLKRAIQSQHVKIESLGEALSIISTVSLDPEPIPLNVKVVLLGDRMLYYLLYQHDHDFAELFKVAADFDEQMDRSVENCQLYARFVATLAKNEKLRLMDRGAVARIIEHSARVAGDSEKLSTHMRTVADLLREADYWADQGGRDIISSADVQRSIEQQVYRVERVRQRIQEEIQRGTILIDTDGETVGQVNGLSVLDMGNFAFGRPSRITATARLGKGEVIDIEREVELGGAIHSKGVLILSSFLASRYAKDQPLSLSASIAFEQSYGMVDGDSASIGELCSLLSVLADVPIKQSLAVTGSVNQHGQVQPIGGANEKIEGFFDVCRTRGLTGRQGVLIPASNVKHLMLREDVVSAAAEGRFHIYPIETIDEAITLLTGVPAGQRDCDGRYSAETINGKVEARLAELSQIRQQFGEGSKSKKSSP